MRACRSVCALHAFAGHTFSRISLPFRRRSVGAGSRKAREECSLLYGHCIPLPFHSLVTQAQPGSSDALFAPFTMSSADTRVRNLHTYLWRQDSSRILCFMPHMKPTSAFFSEWAGDLPKGEWWQSGRLKSCQAHLGQSEPPFCRGQKKLCLPWYSQRGTYPKCRQASVRRNSTLSWLPCGFPIPGLASLSWKKRRQPLACKTDGVNTKT